MSDESNQYVFFLGTNAALSAVELVSVVGETVDFTLASRSGVALVPSPTALTPEFLQRLGGFDRFGVVLAQYSELPTAEAIVECLEPLPDRKWQLGVSAVTSHNINTKQLAIEVKKAARARGSKVSFTLPKHGSQLNTAQVLVNTLTDGVNAEITLVETATGWLVVRTLAVQDIAAYEQRDTKRPGRDTQVGMLPPKLAQMMLNIAMGALDPSDKPYAILDPFCGMGTVLQEGWLLGQQMVGSDASERMVNFSERNLQWLFGHFAPLRQLQPQLAVHDVQEDFPAEWAKSFDAVVTEPYLGKALSSPLPYRKWRQRVKELQRLYMAFFEHSHNILRSEGVILALLPVISTDRGRAPSPTPLPQSFLDSVSELGYSMEQFVPSILGELPEVTNRGTLVYGRPDAMVRRELTLWRKR